MPRPARQRSTASPAARPRLRGWRPRRAVALLVGSALVAAGLSTYVIAQAVGDDADRCTRFAQASAQRAEQDSGSGPRVVVVGDSYSVGLGLDRPRESWPSRLPGRVHVAGFSGSGFSRGASPCGPVSFADRAGDAVAGGARLVVVEGGLNDWNQPEHDVRAGFDRLLRELDGLDVLVVGPPDAPSRSSQVTRVDRLLAGLAERHGATYLSMASLELTYLPDDLHLTAAGHERFGDTVAEAVDALLPD